jgi:G3E family GTPase
MHLLLVTGFLGSGKTTFIINVTNQAIDSGLKTAIVVNEIGEIGIDDQMMRRLDLNVWEMMSGCICCTLSADLVTTLQQLDQDYDVDLVIVEPSGAAEPGNILNALPYYKGRPLDSIRSIALLDPLRITELYAVLTPLVTKQIEKADPVIVTKADLASSDEIESARTIAREINPSGRLYVLAVNQPLPEDLRQKVLP